MNGREFTPLFPLGRQVPVAGGSVHNTPFLVLLPRHSTVLPSMTDLRLATKEFLTEFIETYRSHPALWKVKSKDHVNRNLKIIGYDALVELYKKVDSNAYHDLVAKKI